MSESPNQNARRHPPSGVMLHYTGGDFAGSVAWCRDPMSKVSYHVIVGPDGERRRLVPYSRRAWHAGVCRPSGQLVYTDGNSATIGVAVATGSPPHPVTPAQFNAVVAECRAVFAHYQWPLSESWRIVGHASEAWPRGRKTDPEGDDLRAPVLSVAAVRAALQARPA